VIAAAFAFMHNGLGVFALFRPVLFSLLASLARHRTGSLGIAVLVHFTWNTTMGIFSNLLDRFACA
jgi:membrane protease YdiL (CAAX protease family)